MERHVWDVAFRAPSLTITNSAMGLPAGALVPESRSEHGAAGRCNNPGVSVMKLQPSDDETRSRRRVR
jgi:hypothetical protein